MRNHLIAIQGSVASFHDLAAKKYFGEEVTVLECNTFKEVCNKIKTNVVDYGIIAIENKVAGSILLNYQLIEEYDLKIIGEIYLPIELQLLGKPGSVISEVKEIISHPMALGQSQQYLSELKNVIVSEFKDTASCAKLVLNDDKGKLAVIAGPVVGSKYGLSVLADKVGDVKENYTRFYILSKAGDYAEDANKASITIRLADKAGQLYEVLGILKDYDLNVTKIQSVPIPNNLREYSFHLDIEYKNKEELNEVINLIQYKTKSLKVLGLYRNNQN